MAEEKYGIQETKELLSFVFSLAEAIKKSNADGDFNWRDGLNFIEPLKRLGPAIDNIEDIIPQLYEDGKNPLVVVLDRVTDVGNFGAIARTAECEGVDAILIPNKGSAQVTADAIKTSAGALNRIKVCKSDNFKDSLYYIQQCGLRLVACTEKASVPLYETNLRGSVAVIMGSEMDGITSDLINMADISCKIPMRGEIASLNVGVATGMVLYEKLRQELH